MGESAEILAFVASAPGAMHVIEIFDGAALTAAADWPARWGMPAGRLAASAHTLNVWLDGSLLWSTVLKRAPGPSDAEIGVGTNFQGFSTAPREFPGVIQFDPFPGDTGREFLEKNTGNGK